MVVRAANLKKGEVGNEFLHVKQCLCFSMNSSVCWFIYQVAEAVERSGPVHRLGAKLSEIQTGLRSVQKRLEERSPTVTQAKVTQKVSNDLKDDH